MQDSRHLQIHENLKRLAHNHSLTMSLLEESISLLQAEIEKLEGSQFLPTAAPTAPSHNWPVIDRNTMCIVFGGKQCHLGTTLMLRFIERLMSQPNRCISINELLRDVWNGIREISTVRSLVKELRSRLRAAGLEIVSDAIDGHRASGHYGFFFDRSR